MMAAATARTSVVFVVDDDASVRRALQSLLCSAGFDVEVFDSPEVFLERPKPAVDHCLVLDLELPGMTGLQLQERMAAGYADTPIIFITAHGDVSSSVRAMKAGAVEFLLKPFEERELLDSIELALAKSQRARVARHERDELQSRYESLRPREREVMNLVVKGLPNKQIGSRLGVTESTVKVHRGHVMSTMRAASLPDLVRMAQKLT